MELEKEQIGRHVRYGSRKIFWSFQSIFNTLFVLFFILTSVGLWTCLVEISKLKQSTNSIKETLTHKISEFDTEGIVNSVYSNIPQGFEKHDVSRDNSDNMEENKHNKSLQSDDRKSVFKRSAVPVGMAYDPLSSAPHKGLTEYCVTLLSEKCGSRIPGAPAVGPPGPPGPPGDKGEQGRQGVMGHMGPPGLNGQKGQKGEKGDTGRVGEPGSDGPRGPPGFPGVNGIQGANGRRGKRGLPGQAGKPGADGIPGIPGQKGEKGEPGDPGGTINMKGGNCSCYGMQGFPGPTGPQGPKGDKGDNGYCIASHCGEKYVRQKSTEQTDESYTVKTDSTTEPTTTTTTTPPPTTTVATVPPSIKPRSTVCRLKRIATPVFISSERSLFGSIMSDPLTPGAFWIARDYHGQFLERYNSLKRLKKRLIDTKYNLQINRYYGTQHAIFNNSFYYQFNGKQHVVRYDLNLHDVVTATLPIQESHFNDSKYLYKDSRIYYDITADENGLWIVYGRPRGNASYIHVIKADPITMDFIRVWKLQKKIGVYKNGFIACGILYLVKDFDPKQTETEIDFAYDFYNDEENNVNIKLKVPFGKCNMLTFYTNTSDRKSSMLLAWDNGNIIKYPLLF